MPESGKKLSELRVCDLKEELDRRELDTAGTKAALLERLQAALKSEGIDPSTYVYQQNPKSVKKASPVKMTDNVLIKEEPTDLDNSAHDDEANGTYDNDHLIDEVGTVDDECVIIEDDDEYYTNGDGDGDEQAEDEEENYEAEDNNGEGDTNNADNEESINLTIGEEEQKLLHDEAPDDKEKSTEIPTKKGGARKEADEKSAGKEKSDNSGKNDKVGKDDDAENKNKTKIDEKPSDKKDDSEQKSSSKTAHKDDKEKSTAASSNTAATNAAGDASKSAASSKSTTPSRNLWVSGLSSLTRASDLKMIFSKYGKVIGAKVVTNTRTPGTRCYGYVTMSSSNDASRCIEHLHRTELHGRIISVERTKNEIGGSASSASNTGNRSTGNPSTSTKKREDDKKTSKTSSDEKKKSEDQRKNTNHSSSSKKDDSKKDDKTKKDEKEKEKSDSKTETDEAGKEKKDKDRSDTSSAKRPTRRGSRSKDRTRPDRNRNHDREREQRQKERERERERFARQREILSYQKIREERERQRLREKERELRKEELRRREIRERQRQEEQRLADERKKLAVERERLEKEKAELLRLERERQKLEREKIELERLELKRQQMKIITQTRDEPAKRPAKRSGEERYADVPDRKRSTGTDSRFEAPPPPRFDAALVPSRSSTSTKRGIDEYSTSKRTEYSSKRDDYTSSNTKRSAVDDYAPAPPKRSTDEYSKRAAGDFISSSGSKRGVDDYSSTSKRDDYSSKIRDDYKREVEIRHIPSASNAVSSSSYIHKSSGGRYVEPEIQVRSSVTSFRRIDDRSDSRSGNKRYDTSNSYGNNVWGAQSSSSHMGHSSSGVPALKSYVSNGMSSNVHSGGSALWPKSSIVTDSNWRSMTSTQDRYDRTYNERSGGYIDSSRQSSNMYGGRPTSDRYGDVSSRYPGKY